MTKRAATRYSPKETRFSRKGWRETKARNAGQHAPWKLAYHADLSRPGRTTTCIICGLCHANVHLLDFGKFKAKGATCDKCGAFLDPARETR